MKTVLKSKKVCSMLSKDESVCLKLRKCTKYIQRLQIGKKYPFFGGVKQNRIIFAKIIAYGH
jgi:hypothetical protein